MAFQLLDIVDLLLQLVIWIIVIQAIFSWLLVFNVINLSNDFIRRFLGALDRLTEPLYRPLRRIVPDLGGLDISPMIVIVLLIIARKLVAGAQASLITGTF